MTVKAQFKPLPVKISDQVVLYQGTNYHIHTIKKGQTLFGICKAYGISQNELRNSNPGIILNPLSVGTVLKIPVKKEINSENTGLRTYKPKNYIIHIVQAKETLYSLAKKYNVEIDEILSINSGVEQGLSIGQNLKIPKITVANVKEFPDDDPFIDNRYKVKQGDTLYRISQTFEISINELLFANPELRWGLKTGQNIIIPSESTAQLIREKRAFDSVFTILTQSSLTAFQCDSIAALKRGRPSVKMALLLPFFAQLSLELDTATVLDTLIGKRVPIKKRRLKGRVAAEIYEGILLSIDSLRHNNINISLFTYDTEADTNRIKEILNELDIIEPDIIIGPLSPDNISIVSRFSFERKIPFIPPLADKEENFIKNPYVFRINPTQNSAYNEYSDHLSRYLDQNVILVYNNHIRYKKEVENFKNILLERYSDHGPDSSLYHEVYIDDTLTQNLNQALRDSMINRVIVFSRYEPDVINTISHLHFKLRDYQIEVFGMPAWQKFDNVRIDVLHELQVTLFSPFYINHMHKDVKRFIHNSRETFRIEPYKTSGKGSGINYTYLGYDLGMYFIPSIHKFGINLCNCTQNYSNPQLLSAYNFARNPRIGNLENRSISILRYTKDYRVEKLNP